MLDKGLVIDIYVRGPVTTADFMTVGRTASDSKNFWAPGARGDKFPDFVMECLDTRSGGYEAA
jgi:hypothetical protein